MSQLISRTRRWRCFFLLASMTMVWQTAELAGQEISLTRKFSGKIGDPVLKTLRPKSGIVNDTDTWQKLWQGWRTDKPFVPIDFQEHLVLVETAPGPNLVFANTLKLNPAGDLQYDVASTKIGGPGFGYLIMVIPNTGIQSVNGSPVDAQPEFPALETIQPGTTMPAQEPPVDPTTRDVDSVGKQSVRVEIIGQVRTNIMSAGAETTGTLVAADNIVWELDLNEDPELIESVRTLGQNLARITGRLTKSGGVEARVRWIVEVDSLEALDLMPVPRSLPPKSDIAEDAKPPEATNATAQQPTDVTPDRQLAPSAIAMPIDDRDATDSPVVRSFSSIAITTSDGQRQTISGDGQVEYQFKATKNQWQIKAETLSRFHRFVANTPWDQVPRVTRDSRRQREQRSYNISIVMPRGVTRIFIDASVVADQPTISEFFSLVAQSVADRQ